MKLALKNWDEDSFKFKVQKKWSYLFARSAELYDRNFIQEG